LKEYTYRELRTLFRQVGFVTTKPWMSLKMFHFPLPETAVLIVEKVLQALPRRLAKGMALRIPLRSVCSDITIVGWKGAS